jgi:hypothetical protein
MTTERKPKFNLKDWFFSPRPTTRTPAKSAFAKVRNWFKLPTDEYATLPNYVRRTMPKRYRRGRGPVWRDGVTRWKFASKSKQAGQP